MDHAGSLPLVSRWPHRTGARSSGLDGLDSTEQLQEGRLDGDGEVGVGVGVGASGTCKNGKGSGVELE
jgi:hypothetical protein